LAVLALSLVGGCLDHTPLGPGADVVVVHAVLDPTTSVQHVDVRYAARDNLPVHDATVTLTAPDGSAHVATEVTPTGRANVLPRYDVAMGALTVGMPYHLRVVTPDGLVAEGDAIVPAMPTPQTMAERRLDPATDTLRLSWPRVAGARAYEVRIDLPLDSTYFPLVGAAGEQAYSVFNEFLAYVDTSVTIAGSALSRGHPLFAPGMRYEVTVSAVDAHYYDYFAHQSDPYTTTPLPSSLRGGVGVFGAIVPVLRQAIVVAGSPPSR
jgi:hypothetical protein